MKKGKLIIVVLLIVMVLNGALLFAAGSKEASEAAAETTEKFKMAILLPGSRSDQSWNGGMYFAAIELNEQLENWQFTIIERTGWADLDPFVIEFARKGYNIVLGHSDAFEDSMQRLAPEYPDTFFLHSGDPEARGKNFMSYGPDQLYQAGYLAGILAAGISKNGKVGFIAGEEIPPMIASYNAFKRGARATKSNIETFSAYPGIWYDVTLGRETALAMMDKGVDVIMTHGDGMTLGIIQAASMDPDVFVVGYIIDQSYLSTDTIVASRIWDFKVIIEGIIDLYTKGTLGDEPKRWGIKENAVTLTFNSRLADMIPQEIRDKIEKTEEDIKTGKLTIEYEPNPIP